MKTMLFIILACISLNAKSQTWDEVFRQKKTQEKYLIQQLAALKLYSGYLKKGYDIASKGINGIKSFSKGEFNLHQDFFNSLENVNPAIAKNGKIAEIIKWQATISIDLNTLNTLNGFSAEDKSYFRDVRAKLSKECNLDLDELLLIITSGKVIMKDDERIERLDGIHERMEDKLRFTKSFLNDIKTLKLQRQQELKNAKSSQELYQIIN
ncbi:hypothetical protein ABIB40_002934 [Pedobacter sp. UYP30]|uniref:hypothetical protein n=1 Tax=Pedobacter sp. UYP30 TaxID=1756400 RepID=UPI003396444C